MDNYAEYITKAKANGGICLIGQAGQATIHFDRGATLSSYDVDQVKEECLAAGLPLIDSRHINFGDLCDIVIKGPLLAINEPAEDPPYHGLNRAPVSYVAELYRKAGSLVYNI